MRPVCGAVCAGLVIGSGLIVCPVWGPFIGPGLSVVSVVSVCSRPREIWGQIWGRVGLGCWPIETTDNMPQTTPGAIKLGRAGLIDWGDWRGRWAAIGPGRGWFVGRSLAGLIRGAYKPGRGRKRGGAGRFGPRSCPDRGKTGGFCNTFRKQNDRQTDTRPMRTRVNHVILYARTVILGPKKTIPLLRILEKKISKQKNVQTGWTQGEFSNPQGKFRNFLNHVMLIFLVIFYMIF